MVATTSTLTLLYCVRQWARAHVGLGGTDFKEFAYDQGGFDGRDAPGGDEEDMSVVGKTFELGDELAGHDKGACDRV